MTARKLLSIVVTAVLVVMAWYVFTQVGDAPTKPTNTPSSSPSASTSPSSSGGVGRIAIANLPPEAQQTIRLIDRGGPFPYSRDGATFGNFEGLLPKQSRGYYREYTVKTPGSRDRGARRIVQGKDQTMYYTEDHYRSFAEVLR